MTPATFMSISQQSKPKSSPNKLGWKVAFDPWAQRGDFSTSARLFSAEVSLGGFTSSYNWNCRNRIYWGFENHKVGPPEKLLANPNKRSFSESLRAGDIGWQKLEPNVSVLSALLSSRGSAVTSRRRSGGSSFTAWLRRRTFRLIIVVGDISKRIMRMKCD